MVTGIQVAVQGCHASAASAAAFRVQGRKLLLGWFATNTVSSLLADNAGVLNNRHTIGSTNQDEVNALFWKIGRKGKRLLPFPSAK